VLAAKESVQAAGQSDVDHDIAVLPKGPESDSNHIAQSTACQSRRKRTILRMVARTDANELRGQYFGNCRFATFCGEWPMLLSPRVPAPSEEA
jgi:hypothetical protein